MKRDARTRAIAVAKTDADDPRPRLFGAFLFIAAAFTLVFAAAAFAQDEKIIKSHGFSVFGDLKYPADFPHLDYVNPTAPKGGEISSWEQGAFDSLHRYSPKGEQAASATIFFEPLMTSVADEPDSIYGLIAETIEYPESRQWVIFNLRPEARFSDGSPVTAEDVAFSYNILITKGLPSLPIVFKDVESVEILDTHKVKFTFVEGAITRELPALVGGIPVFSKAWWEGTDKDGNPRDFSGTTLEAPLGSGPYVLEKMEVGRSITYVYNPDYWGKDLAINVGRNNFERIRYQFYADPTVAMEAFKTGEYTFRNENSSLQWATAYDFPAINEGNVVKKELPDGDLASAQGFIFNLRNPKFEDPRVREAIGYMFNFEWSNKTLFYGLYARVNSFYGNSQMEATGVPTPEEVAILETVAEHLPDGILTDEVYLPPVSSERQTDRKAIRAANTLLDEAGWEIGDDGMRYKDGEKLTVEFLTASPLFDRIINPYVENLERIGVEATLLRIDSAAFQERVRTFDFEMMTQTIANEQTPGIGLRQWWNSLGRTTNTGNRNLMGIANPAVDELVERVIASETREELTLNVKVLDRALRSMKLWVPQWFKDVHTVAYWDQYVHPEEIPPYALGAFDFWWLDAEKADALKASGAL